MHVLETESRAVAVGGKQAITGPETVSHDGIRIERRVGLRAVTRAPRFLAIWDSLVCEYRLLSLASFTQPTIHSAPTLAFARSILSKPLASHSKLQTSSRHLQRYPHSTSFTSELALT
jgi:hypothetical protein